MSTTPRLAAILAADVVGYTSGSRASLTLSLPSRRGPLLSRSGEFIRSHVFHFT
jgi:hypothetical protein